MQLSFLEHLRGAIDAKASRRRVGEFEVPEGKRLVLALDKTRESINCMPVVECTLHDMPGRVVAGEPDRMTVAERDVLAARSLSASGLVVRLCVITTCPFAPSAGCRKRAKRCRTRTGRRDRATSGMD